MADEKQTPTPNEESKKDTVRINLPPGLAGRPAAAAPGGPQTVKLKPATQEISTEEEAKKETAVMGRPATVPKAKSDTSRVQVSGKPTTPETPRPTVKLKQPETPGPAAVPSGPVPVPAVVVSAGPSAADAALSSAAMVVAIVSAVYLFMLSIG